MVDRRVLIVPGYASSDDINAPCEVRLWDADTGKPIEGSFALVGATDGRLVFSRDGRRLIVGNRVLDAETLTPIPAPGAPGALAYSPSGKRYSAPDSPGVPTFRPDGRRFVAHAGSIARVRDATTGAPTGPVMVHDGIIVASEFSPDGTYLATSGSGVVRVWDAATGLPVNPRLERCSFVAFRPDSRAVLVREGDGAARVYEVGTGAALSPRLGPTRKAASGPMPQIAFAPDGRRVLVALYDATSGTMEARLWNLATTARVEERFRINVQVFGEQLVLAPDGRHFAALTYPAQEVERPSRTGLVGRRKGQLARLDLYDAGTGRHAGRVADLRLLDEHGYETSHAAVSFSDDGTRLVAFGAGMISTPGGYGGSDEVLPFRVFDVDGMGLVAEFSRKGRVKQWVLGPGGRHLALGNDGEFGVDGGVEIRDIVADRPGGAPRT
jgi:WD40 repeat protein